MIRKSQVDPLLNAPFATISIGWITFLELPATFVKLSASAAGWASAYKGLAAYKIVFGGEQRFVTPVTERQLSLLGGASRLARISASADGLASSLPPSTSPTWRSIPRKVAIVI